MPEYQRNNDQHKNESRDEQKVAPPAEKTAAVQSAAQSRLTESGYRELQQVSCEYREGILTLRGRIPSYYLKQVAQTLIRELNLVGEIRNRLEVGPAS